MIHKLDYFAYLLYPATTIPIMLQSLAGEITRFCFLFENLRLPPIFMGLVTYYNCLCAFLRKIFPTRIVESHLLNYLKYTVVVEGIKL